MPPVFLSAVKRAATKNLGSTVSPLLMTKGGMSKRVATFAANVKDLKAVLAKEFGLNAASGLRDCVQIAAVVRAF